MDRLDRNRISTVAEALFVINGVEPARDAAASADQLFASEVSWTVLAIIPEHPRNTTGATGFAGPVMTLEEMDSLAMADRMAGDAATAATARAFGRRPVTQSVARGRLAPAVARHLAEHPIDLVVVDSPDVAENLVGDGIVPVLVIPPNPLPSPDGPVLLALDDSPLDEAIVATATRLFDPSKTDYVAVHVDAARSIAQAAPTATLAPGSTGVELVSALGDELDAAAAEAERVASRAVADIDGVEAIGEAGDPASAILIASAEQDASMIVLGTHDRGWLSRLFRPSVTDAVLQQAQRPVLVMSMPSDRSADRLGGQDDVSTPNPENRRATPNGAATNSDATPSTGADTLVGVLEEAAERGYETQQIARSGGLVECTGCGSLRPSADFTVHHFRRLEGASDAADLLLVLWSPCPACDRRGVLTLAYGPNADDTDMAVVDQIDLGGADPSPTASDTRAITTAGDASDARRPLNVLIGVDETPASRAAVETAFDLFGADSNYTIVCIYERQPFIVGGVGLGATVPGMYARIDENIGRHLASEAASRSFEALPDDADVDFLADVGHVGSTIAETAVENDSDIIVIGSHDRSLWERLFTPSVGKYLVDHAPCPVLVVR